MEASSERARSISGILNGFKTVCKEVGVKIGRRIHIVLSPNNIKDEILLNFPKFLKFRRKIIKMMEQSGIFTGVIFTHIWTFRCKICGKIDHYFFFKMEEFICLIKLTENSKIIIIFK